MKRFSVKFCKFRVFFFSSSSTTLLPFKSLSLSVILAQCDCVSLPLKLFARQLGLSLFFSISFPFWYDYNYFRNPLILFLLEVSQLIYAKAAVLVENVFEWKVTLLWISEGWPEGCYFVSKSGGGVCERKKLIHAPLVCTLFGPLTLRPKTIRPFDIAAFFFSSCLMEAIASSQMEFQPLPCREDEYDDGFSFFRFF